MVLLKSIKNNADTFHPASYYARGQSSLYIDDEFYYQIMPICGENRIPWRKLEDISFVDLQKRGIFYDQDIVVTYLNGKKKVKKHPFTLDQLAMLIDAQEKGGVGILLTNGDPVILYMIGHYNDLVCVELSWNTLNLRWAIHVSGFNAKRRRPGSRILFCK